MEHWYQCGPAVLRYQIHWLIFWTLVIVKKKKSRRKKSRRKKSRRKKTRMDEFDFDDFTYRTKPTRG